MIILKCDGAALAGRRCWSMVMGAKCRAAALAVAPAVAPSDTGRGVTQNYAEALKWYRLAANQGYADAQKELGHMYVVGHGMPENDAEAAKWFRKAAEQGNENAQWFLGSMYANAQGVPQNYAEAIKWLTLAADKGYAPAQLSLGARYADGDGAPQDYVRAYTWFNLSAAQGGLQSQEAEKRRGIIAQRMTPEQIAEAQKLTREWKPTPR